MSSKSDFTQFKCLSLGRVNSAMLFMFILFSLNSVVYCVFNAEEIKSVSYEIDILNVPVKAEQVIDSPVLHMTSKFGQQYQCQLPELQLSEDKGDESGEPEIPDVTELLEPLGLAPCLLKVKDWWTYEFCYGKHIRQYHIEDSQISGAILTLGVYDMSKSVEKRSVHEENSRLEQNRYHSQHYVNGSKCDLTGTLRSSELRFFCEPDSGDYIARVDEPETCHYIVTIYTSRVCSHPHLKPLPSIKPHTILCNPVLPEEHYTKYLQRVEAEKEKSENDRRKWLAEQKEKLEELKVKLQEQEKQVFSRLIEQEGFISEIDDFKGLNEADETNNENLEGRQVVLKSLQKEAEDLNTNVLKESQDKTIFTQVKVIKEAEKMLQTLLNDENKDETKVAQTLNDLIDKLTRVEKDIASTSNKMQRTHDAINNLVKKVKTTNLSSIKKNSDDAAVEEDDEEELEDEEASLLEDESPAIIDQSSEMKVSDETTSESKDAKSLNTLEDDGKVRVRIRRVNSDSSKSDGKLQWFRHKGLDAGQKQKLEDAVKEKLEEAGLDTSGRHIEVKIITAGYYDDEDGKDFHVLSDEETQQFQSMILTLLTRNQEARKEMDRHRKLEQNYQFKWSDDGIELQDPNEEE